MTPPEASNSDASRHPNAASSTSPSATLVASPRRRIPAVATVIGEPLAIGKEKGKIWEKLMNARVVYLGEAEQVPVRDDRELELEIVKNLHRRCLEKEKRLSLALEVFPANLQEPLNQYMDKKYNNAFQILINA